MAKPVSKAAKKKAIKAHAKDLKELATEYANNITVLDSQPDYIIDWLYAISIEHNKVHDKLNKKFVPVGLRCGEL